MAPHAPAMPEETVITPAEELVRALEAGDQSAILAAASETHYAALADLYAESDEEKLRRIRLR